MFAVAHTMWSLMPSSTSNRLTGVWGSSETDIYAVGAMGTVLRYDGTSWTPAVVPGGPVSPLAVWGTSANNVLIVGHNGAILHRCGSGPSPTPP